MELRSCDPVTYDRKDRQGGNGQRCFKVDALRHGRDENGLAVDNWHVAERVRGAWQSHIMLDDCRNREIQPRSSRNSVSVPPFFRQCCRTGSVEHSAPEASGMVAPHGEHPSP